MKQVDIINKEELDKERFQVHYGVHSPGKAKRLSSFKRKGCPVVEVGLKLHRRTSDVVRDRDRGMANKENELTCSDDVRGVRYNDNCGLPVNSAEASKMAGASSKYGDFTELLKDHEAMNHVLFGRNLRLKVAQTLWRRNASELVAYLIRIQDMGVLLDCLPVLTNNLQTEAPCLSLGCCVDLIPQVKVILASKYEEHITVGLHWVQSVIRKWWPELSENEKRLRDSRSEDRNIEVMKQRLKDLWKEGARLCSVPGSTGELAKVTSFSAETADVPSLLHRLQTAPRCMLTHIQLEFQLQTKINKMWCRQRAPLLWVCVQAALVVASCFTDMETGPGAGAPTQPNGDRFKIEGRAIVPGMKTQDWVSTARILVEGEEYVGFVRTDGSFAVNDVPSGSYVVEVVTPNHRFEPVRVDITSKGKMRARLVNYIKTSEVIRQPYPLQIRANGPQSYFIKRETWGWTDFLMNPMVMMMVLPLLIIVLLPKVVNTNDPEMRKEMEQSMNMLNPNPELPDVSELMTKLFSGSKGSSKAGGSSKGTRPAVKRR